VGWLSHVCGTLVTLRHEDAEAPAELLVHLPFKKNPEIDLNMSVTFHGAVNGMLNRYNTCTSHLCHFGEPL
jgi:hypothetical protein